MQYVRSDGTPTAVLGQPAAQGVALYRAAMADRRQARELLVDGPDSPHFLRPRQAA